MVTLDALARSFAAKYPRPELHPFGGGKTWDQRCGSLMNRMCAAYGKAPTPPLDSAYIVYIRSTIVSKDASKARIGDFHFWDIAGRLNGHVGLDTRGGGSHVFMATNSVSESLGSGIGFLSVAGYTKAKAGRAVYLGHSRGYADGDVTQFTAPTSTVAASGLTPVGEPDMSAKAEQQISNVYAAIFQGAEVEIDGKVQKFKYGILPIVAHNQTLIAQQAGKIGALVVAVNQLSQGEPLNMAAIEAAAERGSRDALDGITVTVNLPAQ